MKRIAILLVTLLVTLPVFGQEKTELLNQEQKDSLILQTYNRLEKEAKVGRYKVYPTTNIYTSLKLDTATGQIWALQIGLGKDSARMQYEVTDAVFFFETTAGRFELYPTNNNFNFILLDTIDGWAYQVQWSTKKEECGSWLMY